jgi:hypothetical protein
LQSVRDPGAAATIDRVPRCRAQMREVGALTTMLPCTINLPFSS